MVRAPRRKAMNAVVRWGPNGGRVFELFLECGHKAWRHDPRKTFDPLAPQWVRCTRCYLDQRKEQRNG